MMIDQAEVMEMAEGVGFEPTWLLHPSVFETAPLIHLRHPSIWSPQEDLNLRHAL